LPRITLIAQIDKAIFLALADLTDWADFKNLFNHLICGCKLKRRKDFILCAFVSLRD